MCIRISPPWYWSEGRTSRVVCRWRRTRCLWTTPVLWWWAERAMLCADDCKSKKWVVFWVIVLAVLQLADVMQIWFERAPREWVIWCWRSKDDNRGDRGRGLKASKVFIVPRRRIHIVTLSSTFAYILSTRKYIFIKLLEIWRDKRSKVHPAVTKLYLKCESDRQRDGFSATIYACLSQVYCF